MPLLQVLVIPPIPRYPRAVLQTMMPTQATLTRQGALAIMGEMSCASLNPINTIIRQIIFRRKISIMTTVSIIQSQTLKWGGLLTGARVRHLLRLPLSLFMWITTARMITAALRYRAYSITLILLRSMIGQRVMQVALFWQHLHYTLCKRM